MSKIINTLAEMAGWKSDEKNSHRQDAQFRRLSKDPAVQELMKDLGAAVMKTSKGAARISQRLQTVAEQVSKAGDQVEGLSLEVEELRKNAQGISMKAAHVSEMAQETATKTHEGSVLTSVTLSSVEKLQQSMDAAYERINQFVERVRTMQELSQVVADIAFKTKLLALNAAIEAARAGEHGRGFHVVADEVRKLAEDTARQNKQILSVLQAISNDISPAKQSIEQSKAFTDETAAQSQELSNAFHTIAQMVNGAKDRIGEISDAVYFQNESIHRVSDKLAQVRDSVIKVRNESTTITENTFALSMLTEDAFLTLEKVEVATMFHRALPLAREMVTRVEKVFETAINSGIIALEDVLAYRYTEIRGARIQMLSRLFDVSRVPASGFNPPKYETGYDSGVDRDLMEIGDDILARDSNLVLANMLDLNSYAPSGNTVNCAAWTGDYEKDLIGNRVKRTFPQNRVLVRGARLGLGPEAMSIRDMASRAEFIQKGCLLEETEQVRNQFLVQTYARDTGSILSILTMPVFVKRQRWGVVIVGWDSDNEGK